MKKTTKIVLKAATKFAVKTAKDAAVRHAAKATKEIARDLVSNNTNKNPRYDESAPIEVNASLVVLRSITESDRAAVIELMRSFYASDAVLSNGSEEIFGNDIDACVSDNPYLEGYVFTIPLTSEAAGSPVSEIIAGYAMIAHSFSTEYGKPCIWIEDIYLREEARGLGLASKFFEFLKSEYPDALHRLESERGNLRAMDLYKRENFSEMPYVELFRDPE